MPSAKTWLLALLFGASSACGGSDVVEAKPPEVQSTAREREYRELRARFFSVGAAQRHELEDSLKRFVRRQLFGVRAREAGLLLAWIYLERGETRTAADLVERAKQGAPNDFVTVTEAALLSRTGQPERALGLLQAITGKIVDPDERMLCEEVRVRAALSAGLNRVAIGAMVDWLVQAPPEQYDAVRAAVERLTGDVPSEDLMPALNTLDDALSSQAASAGLAAVRSWLKKVLYGRLEARALAASDAALARELVPHVPSAQRSSVEFAALARLAAQGSSVPHIAGRAVGLFLSVGTAASRRRSAAVAAGAARELARAKPHAELIVRDDAGSSERVLGVLSGLASDGAAILIAGVDDDSAEKAAEFAEKTRIPVLLLRVPPAEQTRRYGFVVGVDEADEAEALGASMLGAGRQRIARVGSGGVSCDSRAAFAGQARFPIGDWQKQAVQGVVVLGDASCARDVATEIESTRLGALVACGLECAEARGQRQSLEVALGAGTFPDGPSSRGQVSFYEALGRDAAALARAALAGFPEQRVMDQAKVGELHERARSALENADVELWTSEARGLGRDRVLERKLRVIDGGAHPGLKGAE